MRVHVLRCYRSVSVWQLLLELLNFLHIKENTHTHTHPRTKKHPPAKKKKKKQLFEMPFLPLRSFLSSGVVSVLSPLPPLRLSSRCSRSCPRWLGSFLLPLLSAADFVPFLRSSLQWAEKHTCQIQEADRAASHPQQLLSTRSFDPNKFIQDLRQTLGALTFFLIFFCYWWWMQQLVSIGALPSAS